MKNLENWFCDRGYPGSSIDEQLQRVKEKSREELLTPKGMDKKSVEVPFVVTYHPHLKEHIKHLYADPKVGSVFTPLPFVSFCSVQNFTQSFEVSGEAYFI